jgi:hypothetical protein
MARDNQTKMSKKEQMKRNKKQLELTQKKKKNNNSDNDSNNESESESDEMDIHEYRKFISKIFPSKYIDKKIKAGEKLKKNYKKVDNESDTENWETDSDFEEDDEEEYEEEEEEIISKKKSKKTKKNNLTSKPKKTKKIAVSDDDSDEQEDEEEITDKSKKGKVNIIFTIGGNEDKWDDDDEYDYGIGNHRII